MSEHDEHRLAARRIAAMAVRSNQANDTARHGDAYGQPAADVFLSELVSVIEGLEAPLYPSPDDLVGTVNRLSRNASAAVEDFLDVNADAFAATSRRDGIRRVVDVVVAYLVDTQQVRLVPPAEVPPVVIGGEILADMTPASGTNLSHRLQPPPPSPRSPGEPAF